MSALSTFAANKTKLEACWSASVGPKLSLITMGDIDLSQRLQFAESDFFIALDSGTDMLSSYHHTWSALLDTLRAASKSQTVGHETLSLTLSVASRIGYLAGCFLGLEQEGESYTTSLQSDCDVMLHRMVTMDLNKQQSLHVENEDETRRTRSHPTTPGPDVETCSSPFFALACQWLLENLHNPYPSAEVKARIATTSSCQMSSINSWFINARRRIGWTTLCREHFSNCRANMIDAAYRALVEEDPRRPLSPDLRYSLVAMKVAADALLPSTFTRSAFAGELDTVAEDVTQGRKEFVGTAKSCRSEQAYLQAARDSYPSPDRFISLSPVPTHNYSLADESEEDNIVHPVVAGSKRRRSCIEPINQQPSNVRPIKRLRPSRPSATYLPSPPSSTNGADISTDDRSPGSSPAPFIQPETDQTLPSREPQLSGATPAEISNYPYDSTTVPPVRTISDPLSLFNTENESSIDDWFHTNFDSLFVLPPLVEATQPDASAPWEVELFQNYNIPGNPECAPRFPQGSAVTHTLSGLDDLLPSIGGDTFTTPLESVPTPDIAVGYTATGLDSLIPGMLQGSVDWTSLLDGPVMFQPDIDFTFPRYPTDTQSLPEIDLSVLQLPHVTPLIDSQGDLPSKQAKLDQLRAMQDVVRRMEQELQSEGIIA